MRISNSEIATFKRCKRRWYFEYYLQLRRNYESPIGPASIGNRVHYALETYYTSLLRGNTTDTAIDIALGVHNASIQFVLAENETLVETSEYKKFLSEAELSRLMLEGYFEWLQETGADEGLTVVAAEKAVSVVVDEVTIPGKLDLRIHREFDGAVLFMDHKTTQDLSTPLKTLHMLDQPLMYEWLLQQVEPDARVDGGIFNFLRKVKRSHTAKPPFYARAEVRHSKKEIESFEKRLLGELTDIQDLRHRLEYGEDPIAVAYPNVTRDCSWQCPYFQVCPMVDRADGSATRIIELTMHQGNPYERYEESE